VVVVNLVGIGNGYGLARSLTSLPGAAPVTRPEMTVLPPLPITLGEALTVIAAGRG
jgi:hypothetical protein